MALACTQWLYTNKDEPVKNKLDFEIYNGFCKSSTCIEEISIKNILEEELFAIYDECKYENWDSDNALPIPFERYEQAKQFISFIEKLPKPQITPYPNGTIGYDWKINNNDISVMFEKDNYFLYVILAPKSEKYGKEIQDYNNQVMFSKLLESLVNGI